MGQPAPRAVTPDLAPGEQRFVIHGVTWKQYEAMRAATDHIRGLRMTYLQGALELIAASRDHEWVKTCLARLEVPEVWIWKGGRMTLWRPGKAGRYHSVKRSRFLPDLDVAQLLSFVRPDDQTGAVRAYRDALRG